MTDTATKPTKASEEPNRTAGTSPLVYARVAGLLLLFVVLIAPFSQLYVPSTLIVPADATATANNIGASGWLLHLGIISDSLVFLIEIVLCILLYVLLRPVSRTLSLVAAFARLAMTVVMGVNLLPYFIALLLLSGAAYLTVHSNQLSRTLWRWYFSMHMDMGFLFGNCFSAFIWLCLAI